MHLEDSSVVMSSIVIFLKFYTLDNFHLLLH